MLVILLMLVLLSIAIMTAAPSISTQIKRDQEEELMHRGNQYVRAIRLFYRKFGRYPTSLDELKDTNHLRFLRREYKDPITGKEFVLLHPADIKNFQPTGFFGKSLLPPGSTTNASPFATPVASPIIGPGTGAGSGTQAPAADDGQPGGTNAPPGTGTPDSQQQQQQMGAQGGIGNGLPPGMTFAGGPIVGVSSTSQKASIKIWREKDHYNDWQFFWVPAMDQQAFPGQMFPPNTLTPGNQTSPKK
jgi:type II secretory pathway pseudopilin PulG